MDDVGLPDFKGKILILYLKNAPKSMQDGIIIEYPRFEIRLGKVFLSGRIPEMTGQGWSDNCQTAISWDSVVQYIEFKTKKEFVKRMSGVKPTLMQRLGL